MNEPNNVSTDVYDYVIVGGGSSGCIVAARLSENPSVRVLLLEAGDPAEQHPEALAADRYKDAFIHPDLMWDRYSVRQPGANRNRLFIGSGRGMGGSGSVNAMVYTRGAAFDWDDWDLPGWAWRDVVPDFVALEAVLGVERIAPTEFTEACIAAAEASDFARKEDLNDGVLAGHLGYEWMNARVAQNERRSSYVAFLKPHLARPNLTLITRATARRVLFETQPDTTPRAIGVEYQLTPASPSKTPIPNTTIQTVRARREVILCAGALETPRLLLLSGVGPHEELRALGIPVHKDLPGVGKNLMDHPNVPLFFRGKRPTDSSWAQLYGFARANPQSRLPAGEADSCYVFYSARTSFREGAIRLLPAMILPMPLYRIAWLRESLRGVLKWVFGRRFVQRFVARMYGIVVILGKPASRGSVRLASSDPTLPALVDPAYFSDPEDLDTLAAAIARARRIADAPALAEWGNRALLPAAGIQSREQIRRFIAKNVITTYHYAGTCRMGNDNDVATVVDTRLRVRGVSALRIADASVIPTVPVSAMNAPSMLIGYRAAGYSLEDQATL